jgi:hypothetical protein
MKADGAVASSLVTASRALVCSLLLQFARYSEPNSRSFLYIGQSM